MLERIQSIKGIGLLHQANGSQFKLQKATFIYADNGRGKSTLASILRSCSTNDSTLLVNRRTVDGTNEQEVIFQFSHGEKSTFKNGNWDKCRPELLVFDSAFVEQNVYAGGQVSTDQRKNLLKFALGADAVAAQQDYDEADKEMKEATADIRVITNQLAGFHRGKTLDQFLQIQEEFDIDNQITILNSKISETRNVNLIQTKTLPTLLEYPSSDITPILAILETSIADVDITAEQQVKAHLDRHKKEGVEKWISDGQKFEEQDSCPFCDQSLLGVGLIQAYQTYFNKEYNRLKLDVASLSSLIDAAYSDKIVLKLESQLKISNAALNGWQEHLEILPLSFNTDAAYNAISNIRSFLEILKQKKENNLLESVNTNELREKITNECKVITEATKLCNEQITTNIQRITKYKENLHRININELEEKINTLNISKIRYSQDVLLEINKLNEYRAAEKLIQEKKQNKKEALNLIMETTLNKYKDRINELLNRFGAQFTIPNIDFNYRGGLRSDYSLEMRGKNIALNGGAPDFNTSLSEGDKRTLAFAFFIASTESNNYLANKIIVIDDPMCSFDLNRKQQTRTVLKELYGKCEQLILVAHDIHFLRNLRDDFIRSQIPPNSIKIIRLKVVANRYSDFSDINIDQECESAYFKNHRLLEEFKLGNAQSSMEIARSIRPMLEGYLHRRFPGFIQTGLLFGQIVAVIDSAQHPSPLVHAKNITGELNDINSYAGQFHHDTNPSADQVEIIDSELLCFVERAISIVHRGAVCSGLIQQDTFLREY